MIYFACGINDPDCLVKIGFTRGDVAERLAALQTGCPLTLHVILLLEGDRQTERRLHAMFAADRRHGEWYFPSKELRDFIRSFYTEELPGLIADALARPETVRDYADFLRWGEQEVRDGLTALALS